MRDFFGLDSIHSTFAFKAERRRCLTIRSNSFTCIPALKSQKPILVDDLRTHDGQGIGGI
jgi:hypothetical protein